MKKESVTSLLVFSSIFMMSISGATAATEVDNPCTIKTAGDWLIKGGTYTCSGSVGHPDANFIIKDNKVPGSSIIAVYSYQTCGWCGCGFCGSSSNKVNIRNIETHSNVDVTMSDMTKFEANSIVREGDMDDTNKTTVRFGIYPAPNGEVNIGHVNLDGYDNTECGGIGDKGGTFNIGNGYSKYSALINIGDISAKGGQGGRGAEDPECVKQWNELKAILDGWGWCVNCYPATHVLDYPKPKYDIMHGAGGVIQWRATGKVSTGDVDLRGGEGNIARPLPGTDGEFRIQVGLKYTPSELATTGDILAYSVQINADELHTGDILTGGGHVGLSMSKPSTAGRIVTNTLHAGNGFLSAECLYQEDPWYHAGDYNSPILPPSSGIDIGCGTGGGGPTCGTGTKLEGNECVPDPQPEQTTLDFHGRAIFKDAGPVSGGTAEFWVSNEASQPIWGTSGSPAVSMSVNGGLFSKLLGGTGDPQLNLVPRDNYILFVRVCETDTGCEQFELPFEA